MQPKVLPLQKLGYLPATYSGKNEAGCTPLGDRVLILPDAAMSSTVGGIKLTEDFQQRAQLSATSGVVIELGDDAFKWNFDRSRPWAGYRPKPGDRVHFDKYSGKEIVGTDGNTYRLLDDKSIGGVSA